VTYPQKITFGEMRASGVRDVLVYCRDHRCSHHVSVCADRWPDHIRLSDIEPGFVCTACGKRGADVRPNFQPAEMGCPCRKPIDWRLTENRAMLLCNERSCQAHCLGGCRSVSVAGSDRGRDFNVVPTVNQIRLY